MRKLLLALIVFFSLAPFASSAADAQVVVRVGPRYHHPYRRGYYHHRYYYHHPYHRGYYHR